jgi:hypothetical protein
VLLPILSPLNFVFAKRVIFALIDWKNFYRFMMVGDKKRAIDRLQHLLQIPYGSVGQPVTPALLRLDPAWDPLRGDPRFEQIVASLAPKKE